LSDDEAGFSRWSCFVATMIALRSILGTVKQKKPEDLSTTGVSCNNLGGKWLHKT
jgi:hypothetical protein